LPVLHGFTHPQKWVNKQRMEKMFLDEGKRSSMTPRRIECLESIGFTSTWAKRKGDYSWMRHFAEMQQYQAQHGHCNVSTKYDANPPLGRWVSTQRSEYKLFQRGMCTKLMNQTKIDMLNSLAFQWEIPLPEVALARRRAATLLEEQIFVHTFYTLLSRTTKSPPRPHTTA
jgi:Helicase associated domain